MLKPKVADRTILVRLDSLNEDPQNTNVMEPERYAQLVVDIREIGFLQPLLVIRRDDGRFDIVDGHHRARGASEVGMEKVPAIVVDSTEQARRIMNISMNRLRGEPDLAKVSDVLRSLRDSGANLDDLRLTGFNDSELEAMLSVGSSIEDDALDGFGTAPDEEAPTEVRFVIEIPFTDRKDYQRARRALKKMAGKHGDVGAALLALIV